MTILWSVLILFLRAQMIEDPDSRKGKAERPLTKPDKTVTESSRSTRSAANLSPRDWAFAKEFSPVFCQDFGPSIPGLSVPISKFNPEKSSPGVPLPVSSPSLGTSAPTSSWPTAHADYLTRVDFDGNWISTDNWQNFESPSADFRGAVYFHVSESETHYFLHYCVFHPRDWGSIHENDLEGVLVCVEKSSPASSFLGNLVFMETLSHNVFLKYHHPALGVHVPGSIGKILTEGNHPLIYIEPRGHGIHGLSEVHQHSLSQVGKFVIYRHAKQAEHPAKSGLQNVGYELIPLYSTLWAKAQSSSPMDHMFCQNRDYGPFSIAVSTNDQIQSLQKSFPAVGASLCGNDGRPSAAHPPWGWSLDGRWFFQPAETILKDFHQKGDRFSTVYRHHPIFSVLRSSSSP